VYVAATLTLAVAGCAGSAIFGFPVEQGDIAAGRQAFIAHQCHQCHTIAGEQLPALAGMSWPMLQLGGPTTIVRSYEDLTTSIINPDHSISERYRNQLRLEAAIPLESPMRTPDLDTMTVRQLIDIVAFLDSKYEVLVVTYD
jgi:mono/diheme cytochrome c family protein